MNVFIAALFVIAKTRRKQSKDLAVGGWIKKLWHILSRNTVKQKEDKSVDPRDSLDASQKHFAEQKKPIFKAHIMNDST